MTDSYEHQQVSRWRAVRMPWQDVARSLGRPVDSVRADYDPTYLRPYKPAAPLPAPPPLAFTKVGAPNLAERAKIHKTIVAALLGASGFISCNEIFPAIGHKAATQRLARFARNMRATHGPDIIIAKAGQGYRLTPKGRALCAKGMVG